MLWDSSQNRQYKIGLIKTLAIRIHRICSSRTLIDDELDHLRRTLEANGYPPHIVRRGIRESEVIVKINKKQAAPPQKEKSFFFTMTYYGHESVVFAARMRKVFRKFLPLVKVHFAFRKHQTLKNIFLPIMKGKDESKKEKRLVYSIPCKQCEYVYVGQTERRKEKRMQEHKSNIRRLAANSKLVEHIEKYHHEFDFSKVETLAWEQDWRRRTIEESLLTQERLGKTINDTDYTLHVFG